MRTLFSLCNGPFAETLIAWSDDGERIVIADPPRFAEEICPKFFRHKNWTSFSRLLNMYEFHKIPAPPALTPLVEFKHPDFRRDGGRDIWKVVRKKSPSESAGATKRARPGGRPPKKAIVSRVLMPAVPRGPAGAPAPPPPRVVSQAVAPYPAVWKSNLQPDFNARVIERFDTSSSALLRELDESDRFVQKSAESTSI